MRKEILKEVMRKAIEIAKKLEGNWTARMKYALKKAWNIIKNKKEEVKMRFEKFAKKNDVEKMIAKIREIKEKITREELENIVTKYQHIVNLNDIKAFTSSIVSFKAMGINIEELDNFNDYDSAKSYVEKRLLENLLIIEAALNDGLHPKSFDYWLKYIQEKANIAKPLLFNLTYAYAKLVKAFEN